MPSIRQDSFEGAAPRMEPHLLGPEFAQIAENCKLNGGALEPWRAPLPVLDLGRADVQSIYKYGTQWLGWTRVVDVVGSVIPGDPDERIFWTGDGVPKTTKRSLLALAGTHVIDPVNVRPLGIPTPADAPIIAVSGERPGTPATPSGTTETRTYAYCWSWHLNGIPQRTALSAVATVGSVIDGDFVYVGDMVEMPVGGFPANATDKRKSIFRHQGDGNWRLVVSLTNPRSTNYVDKRLSTKLGRQISFWTAVGSPAGPNSAPVLALESKDPELAATEIETRFYRYAYVTDWGDESAPGPVSQQVDLYPWQVATLAIVPAVPGYAHITAWRIYRTDAQGVWRFLADVPIGTGFGDGLLDENLGDPIESEDWNPPPDDLHSLVALPNGILAGISKNEVCFSVIGVPYAWPIAYRLPMDNDGIAAMVTAGGMVIVTGNTPYLAVGVDPAQMALDRLDKQQAATSKRAAVDMGDYALFASPDGLVMAQGLSAEVVSEGSITRDQWQKLAPASMMGFQYEGRYFGFYRNAPGFTQGSSLIGAGNAGYMFDPKKQTFVFFPGLAPNGGYNDPETDTLYLIVGTQIVAWDQGAPMTARYRGKEWMFDLEFCPGAARVIARTYPVTYRLFGDGALKYEVQVQDSRPFRLPDGYQASLFEHEVVATGKVSRVVAGIEMQDLMGG